VSMRECRKLSTQPPLPVKLPPSAGTARVAKATEHYESRLLRRYFSLSGNPPWASGKRFRKQISDASSGVKANRARCGWLAGRTTRWFPADARCRLKKPCTMPRLSIESGAVGQSSKDGTIETRHGRPAGDHLLRLSFAADCHLCPGGPFLRIGGSRAADTDSQHWLRRCSRWRLPPLCRPRIGVAVHAHSSRHPVLTATAAERASIETIVRQAQSYALQVRPPPFS